MDLEGYSYYGTASIDSDCVAAYPECLDDIEKYIRSVAEGWGTDKYIVEHWAKHSSERTCAGAVEQTRLGESDSIENVLDLVTSFLKCVDGGYETIVLGCYKKR